MIPPEMQEEIFASLPPKNATQFIWNNNTYTVTKGYASETDITQAMADGAQVVITIGFSSDYRSDQTPVNNLIDQVVNEDNTITLTVGERYFEDIEVIVYATDNRTMRNVVDKYMDKLIGWYLIDLNEIITKKSRSKVYPAKIYGSTAFSRSIIFTVQHTRTYTRLISSIKEVSAEFQLKSQGLVQLGTNTVAYSLDDDESD